MFIRLNKIIRNCIPKKLSADKRGQAAVVLILVIAAALIFYAVTLNFNHFSQVKGMVTVASNTSAAMLASYVSSYAQSLSESQLGGVRKKCAFTGVLLAIITLVIVVVVTIATGGSGAPAALAAAGKVLAVVGIALAAVNLVLQVAVVQPGITDAWNEIIRRTLPLGNQFTENAIQSALGKSVTDQVRVPDLTDMDNDGFWTGDATAYSNCVAACGDPTNPANAPCIGSCGVNVDLVSRYSMYYSNRLLNAVDGPVAEVSRFLAALDEFVHESCDTAASWGSDCASGGGTPWGIHDHMNTQACQGTAECHPCCRPSATSFDGTTFFGLRPDDCDVNTDWTAVCGTASPFGASYPFVFDPAYEEVNNSFFSFRELLGKDDEHTQYYKDNELTSPVCDPAFGWNPNCVPQNRHVSGDEKFYLEDTTGYYVPPFFTPGIPERQQGIFPFFYKMRDWGVDLALIDIPNKPRECHWCDERGPDPANPSCAGPLGFDGPQPHPNEIPQLVLPLDPTVLTNNIVINTSFCVDGPGTVPAGDPPLWVDKVDLPTDVFADPTVCAEDTLFPTPTPDGFWKPGLDRYCSTTWPYSMECNKNRGSCTSGFTSNFTCACADVPGRASEFPDDSLDEIWLGLGEFAVWAESLLGQGNSNINLLAANLHLWYPAAGSWIQPGASGPCPNCTLEPGQTAGFLHEFLAQMIEMRDRLERWLINQDVGSATPAGYVGNSCTEVWCIPPAGCAQADEAATFDINANGVIGDIEDVVACLDHNVFTAGGNAVRFQTCFDQCNACALDDTSCPASINDVCGGNPGTYLPRSLVPGWDPNVDFIPVNTGQLAAVQACTTGECATCFTTCANDQAACVSGVGGAVPSCDEVNTACQATCTTNNTTCLAACGSSDPLDPAYNPNYGTCVGLCSATLASCVGDGVTCATELANCNTTCDNNNPIGSIPHTGCINNCAIWFGPSSSCTDGCLEDLATCTAACNATQVTCDSGCMCTSAGIDCTAAGAATGSTAARGSCGDVGPGTFLDFLQRSIPEAVNQVAKFQHRRNFLGPRVAEVRNIVDNVFNPAITEFQAFLTGPAQDLINTRAAFDPQDAGLPPVAVYGWQDPVEDDGTPGKWHIVKVEAKSIDYCDGRCDINQTGAIPGWPYIRTYTKGFLGMKRCYELTDETGSVKFRTVRYDEETASNTILFPNGEPIWQFRTLHPSRPQGAAFDPGGLAGTCAGAQVNSFVDGTSTNGVYDGAFMMMERDPNNAQNAACWDLAHRLLTRGVMAETCAIYQWYPGSGGPDGRMDFEFVDCQPF